MTRSFHKDGVEIPVEQAQPQDVGEALRALMLKAPAGSLLGSDDVTTKATKYAAGVHSFEFQIDGGNAYSIWIVPHGHNRYPHR